MIETAQNLIEKLAGRLSIRLLVPLVMALFIVAGLGTFVSNRKAFEAGLERDATRDLNLDLTRLQAALEEAAKTGNSEWMQEQLAAFGADTHALCAALIDPSNIVIASANRAHLGRSITEVMPPELQALEVYQTPRLELARETLTGTVNSHPTERRVAGLYPIILGSNPGELRPNKIGLVLVARDYSVLETQALTGGYRQALRTALILILFAIGTSLLLHFLVTRRLARIASAADQLAAGNLSARSGVTGRDEIALFGRSFDSMVDDIRQNEAALIESEERHRSLFQNAVEGVITMGEDRNIQSINPAALKMFGYEADELIGMNVKMLMPSPYHEEHDQYVQSYLKTGKKKIIGIGREVLGRRKDGSTFPLDLSVAELQLTRERIFTGIVRDITDRKEAELALQRLNEHLEELVGERTRALEDAQEALVKKERLATLGQLAGSVAHEIRNPLGIVRNAAYYLEETSDVSDDETLLSYDEIRRGLTRADRIISELLDYARDPQSRPQEFLVEKVVEDAFEGVDIPTNVSINRVSDRASLMGFGDPDQVARIINNLVINAIQSMSEGGGALTVRCSLSDDEFVAIEVEDTGTGMTSEQLERMFEPLFTTKARGIGLGLALSQRYTELNLSSLSAESTLGQGSRFRLVLPQTGSETETEPPQKEENTPAGDHDSPG